MRLLLLILFVPTIVHSQNKYISLRAYPDKKIIEELKSKNKSSFYKLLVYQPCSDGKEASSIIVIKNKIGINYWVVKNDSITVSGKLKSDKIFSYKNYLKTGATKQEDKLKFVPPLMNGIETESVIYEDAKQKFYFEYGKNVTGYSPDIRLEKYRKEWLEIIKSELQTNRIF